MKIFFIVLFCVGIVTTITYISLAFFYRIKVRSDSRMSYEDFRVMYKIAPKQWEWNSYWKYLTYYPIEQDPHFYKCHQVYMNTYFDNIRLILFWMKKKREEEKETAHRKALELIDSFERDLAIKKNEHTDP